MHSAPCRANGSEQSRCAKSSWLSRCLRNSGEAVNAWYRHQTMPHIPWQVEAEPPQRQRPAPACSEARREGVRRPARPAPPARQVCRATLQPTCLQGTATKLPHLASGCRNGVTPPTPPSLVDAPRGFAGRDEGSALREGKGPWPLFSGCGAGADGSSPKAGASCSCMYVLPP